LYEVEEGRDTEDVAPSITTTNNTHTTPRPILEAQEEGDEQNERFIPSHFAPPPVESAPYPRDSQQCVFVRKLTTVGFQRGEKSSLSRGRTLLACATGEVARVKLQRTDATVCVRDSPRPSTGYIEVSLSEVEEGRDRQDATEKNITTTNHTHTTPRVILVTQEERQEQNERLNPSHSPPSGACALPERPVTMCFCLKTDHSTVPKGGKKRQSFACAHARSARHRGGRACEIAANTCYSIRSRLAPPFHGVHREDQLVLRLVDGADPLDDRPGVFLRKKNCPVQINFC